MEKSKRILGGVQLTAMAFPEIARSSQKTKVCSSYSDELCRLITTVELPEELVYEVFIRLPVKSLLRFLCISKGMNRMIDSSNFAENHNKLRCCLTSERDRFRSLSDDDYAIVLYEPDRLKCFFSVNFEKDNPNLNCVKATELNCPFLKQGMIPMGWSSNGIFCFKNRNPTTRYALWNPFNGTLHKIDSYSHTLAYDSMGYDCVNDDYKIIRLIDKSSLEIYSFRKDSWRKFPKDFPEGSIYCATKAVCVGGVIHWLCTINNSFFIAAFDLATETFTSFPLPLQLQPCHFTDFGGRLCITFFPPPGGSGSQTVWVMEDYGVESSWTELYSFKPSRRRVRIPNFYFPNSERRLLCNIRRLSWWNPQDHNFQRIEVAGIPYEQCISTQAYIYVRNLVRLDQSSGKSTILPNPPCPKLHGKDVFEDEAEEDED